MSGTLIPETPEPNEQKSENGQSDEHAFASSNTTPRTPTKTRDPASSAQIMMAPKKDNKQSSRERARPPTPTDDQYDEEIPDAISAISTLIREARKTIGNMNTSGRNKGIKTTLIEKLSNALLRCSKLKAKVDINNDQRIVEGTGTRPRL
jgi:hypothetical protein